MGGRSAVISLAPSVHGNAAQTKEILGWDPIRPGFIDDMELGHYFNT
ncbi:hypothetical protein [Clostridium beijerinckii]|nr:hypothetical protein [Clostridium beijerinckii]